MKPDLRLVASVGLGQQTDERNARLDAFGLRGSGNCYVVVQHAPRHFTSFAACLVLVEGTACEVVFAVPGNCNCQAHLQNEDHAVNAQVRSLTDAADALDARHLSWAARGLLCRASMHCGTEWSLWRCGIAARWLPPWRSQKGLKMEWEKIEDKWALMVYRVRADWTLPREREQGNGANVTGRDRDATDRPAAVPETAKSSAE